MAFSGTQQSCKVCEKTVDVVDPLTADGATYHQACFRCKRCQRPLKLSEYSSFEGWPYCKPHFAQISNKSSQGAKLPIPKSLNELQRTPSKASFKFIGTQEKCVSCGKTVYPLEKVGEHGEDYAVSVEGSSYHKTCFKCLQGGCSISPSNYAAMEGRLYCKHHFKQLFKEKGNYSQLLVKLPSAKLPPPIDG